MKRLHLFLVSFFLFTSSLYSQENFAVKFLAFAGGYLTGHASHEMGHQLTSQFTGINIGWKSAPAPFFINWEMQYPDEVYFTFNEGKKIMHLNPVREQQRATIARGGFCGEVVSSEIILASSSLKYDDGEYNYFLLGWLTMTVMNPIIYTIYTNNNKSDFDDIKDLVRVGNNEKYIKGFMLTHATVTALRTILKLKETDRFQISSTPTSMPIQISF